MTHDLSLIKEKVKSYIFQAVHVENDKIKDDSLIFKEGFIDSMGFVLLISFLEEEFSIKSTDNDLIEDNFESINAITRFVVSKTTI